MNRLRFDDLVRAVGLVVLFAGAGYMIDESLRNRRALELKDRQLRAVWREQERILRALDEREAVCPECQEEKA